MKKFYKVIIALAVAALAIPDSSAQDEGFIYGKVTTDDKTYEGPIRWGKEEVYWIDVFNAAKVDNENLRYLSSDERRELDEKRYWQRGEFMSSSAMKWLGIGSHDHSRYDYDKDYTHQFSCQFGEIKSLKPLSSKTVEVILQSGQTFEVDGEGYNDVGTTLRILDDELGEIEVNWSRLQKVEFMSTPSKLPQKFGIPMYGSVDSYSSTFTGYFQWDKEERISSDKLDGYSDDGKVSITFDKIKSIERYMSRSKVVLKSGRELELHGTNDVNSENRGIIITDESGMIVLVPWDEFKRLKIAEAPGKPLKKYDDFKSQKELSATVLTADGKSLSGKIIFDLDEAYDFEFYQGKDGEIDYTVPLRYVRKITTKSTDRVAVELKNGDKISLEDSQDTGELNQGILVFSGNGKPIYIPWDNISEIQFK